MSAFRLAALAAAGMLVGSSLAVSAALAQTPTTIISPSKAAIQTFLQHLVVNGVPEVQIVVGTNHALATDAMVAGWISAKIASLAYVKKPEKKTYTLSPAEIEQNIALTNKEVKLWIGQYSEVYNVSYNITPLEPAKNLTFNVSLKQPIVDSIYYNLTATLQNVQMRYDSATGKYYLVASGVEYKYVFYNSTGNLTASALIGQKVNILGVDLKVVNVTKDSIVLEQLEAEKKITVPGKIDLSQYGAPYEIKFNDIVVIATSGQTEYGVSFVIYNAKTGQVIEQGIMTKEQFNEYINKLLENYSIRVEVKTLAKSWINGTPGYVVVDIVKGEFTLTTTNTTLPENATKVLGIENPEYWSYKLDISEKAITLAFEYSNQLEFTPSKSEYKLPKDILSLYVLYKKPAGMYHAMVYGHALPNWNTTNYTYDDLVSKGYLVNFKAINESDLWEVKYSYITTTNAENKTVYAGIKIEIIYKQTGQTAVTIVYNYSNGELAVYTPSGNIPAGNTGSVYVSEFGIYVSKPNTNEVDLAVPTTLPEFIVSEHVQRVLKVLKETVLKEGDSVTVGNTVIKVESISAVPVVKHGYNITVSYTTVEPTVLTPEQLAHLVVTDKAWFGEVTSGTAPANVIAVGGQLVNELVKELVVSNLMQPIKKDQAVLELVDYKINGKTYKVLVVAGWNAELTEQAAYKLLQLWPE
ncbi:MAG: S-layer protein [bacterium]|nr:S-layer protein [bacterium]